MTDTVGIHYTGFWYKSFIEKCAKEAYQTAILNRALGEPISPLQNLACHVLKENGYFSESMQSLTEGGMKDD